MTDELAIYHNPPDTLHRLITDDWYEALGNIVKLAEYVADTEFVPETMRRRPAAVAAAILTGREMGLSPMVSLRMLYIVHGRVGQSAELMRALILRAGHELRDVEVTDTRVILEGRRRGETDWAKASFTADDAKKAGTRLNAYPKDMLYARATSRLARRKFADVIAGLPSVDELEDAQGITDYATAEGPAGPPVQRKRATRAPKAARTQPRPAQPTKPADDDIAELLGDTPQPAASEPLPDAAPNQPDELPLEPELITAPQLKKLHALLRAENLGDRQAGLDWLSAAVSHEITSSKELTLSEASDIIEILENTPQQQEESE